MHPRASLFESKNRRARTRHSSLHEQPQANLPKPVQHWAPKKTVRMLLDRLVRLFLGFQLCLYLGKEPVQSLGGRDGAF